MENCITIFCTVPSREVGETIAEKLVADNSAACVNIVPGITSIYAWKGEMCKDQELLLIIKSRSAKFNEIKELILSLHPYQVPEIIALPIEAGHQDYINWILENS